MNAVQIVLCAAGVAVLGYLALRWLRWHTRLPIPGREQDVRSVMRQQVEHDVALAWERR